MKLRRVKRESRSDSQPQLSMFSLMFQGHDLDNTQHAPPASSIRATNNAEPDAEIFIVDTAADNSDKIDESEMQILTTNDDTENSPFTNIIRYTDNLETRRENSVVRGQVFHSAPAHVVTSTVSPFENVLLDNPETPVTNILDISEHNLEDRVRKAMINVLKDIPALGATFKDQPKHAAEKDDHLHQHRVYDDSHLRHHHHRHHPHDDERENLIHSLIHHQVGATRVLGGKVVDKLTDAANENPFYNLHKDHIGGAVVDSSVEQKQIHHHDHLGGAVVDHVPHPVLHKPAKAPPPPPPPPTPAPPKVTITELESEPGCRSFSTKTCTKVPIIVPKRVPYEECRAVPSVECFFVLKTVDDLECAPVRYLSHYQSMDCVWQRCISWTTCRLSIKSLFSYDECEKEAVIVPYLDSEEVCEQVEFEECIDAEVQVPIKICQSVDDSRERIVNREIAGTNTRTRGRTVGSGSSSQSSGGRSPLRY